MLESPMDESEVQQRIQIEASKYGCHLLRNNSGALKDVSGRVVRFGLGNTSKDLNDNFKSSDLISCMPVVVTQDMVGQTVGIFVAIEVKKSNWKYSGDKREVAQQNFIQWVKQRGGYAGFANSVDSFLRIIGR